MHSSMIDVFYRFQQAFLLDIALLVLNLRINAGCCFA